MVHSVIVEIRTLIIQSASDSATMKEQAFCAHTHLPDTSYPHNGTSKGIVFLIMQSTRSP